MIVALAVGCARVVDQEQALAWAVDLDDAFATTERTLALAVDERMPRFRCDPTTLRVDAPECVAQRAAWQQDRARALVGLRPTIDSLVVGPVAGVELLIPDVGSERAGRIPEPTVPPEGGPRLAVRSVGWGSDSAGPYVITLRKLSVGENDLAIRLVARPADAP